MHLTRPLFLLLIMMLTVGCASSPRTNFYTLSANSAPASGAPANFAVIVGPAEMPRELDRSQIVTRVSPSKVQINETERWAGTLSFEINRVVADNLEKSLPAKRVAAYPAVPRVDIDYRVILDIRQFDGAPGDSVILRGSWTILTAQEQLVALNGFELAQPTADSSFEALVAAHSDALAVLSAEIKTALLEADAAAAETE